MQLFKTTKDLTLKGSLCYIFSFMASNPDIKQEIENAEWEFFFKSNICIPKNINSCYIDKLEKKQIDEKIFNDFEKINKFTPIVNEKSNEIIGYVANLLNTLSYKAAYDFLSDKT